MLDGFLDGELKLWKKWSVGACAWALALCLGGPSEICFSYRRRRSDRKFVWLTSELAVYRVENTENWGIEMYEMQVETALYT